MESAKSIDRYMFNSALENHAIMGLSAQIGRLSEYSLRGERTEEAELLKKDVASNLLFYIAELSTAFDWSMEDLAEMSLEKHGRF